MEYFAGLDVSMEETHVIVVDRDGKVILETRTPTAPKTIAALTADMLKLAPFCIGGNSIKVCAAFATSF